MGRAGQVDAVGWEVWLRMFGCDVGEWLRVCFFNVASTVGRR